MTGFASRKGQGVGVGWAWEMRAVNGKGLDLRLRVPDWIDGLETALRGEITQRIQRGNVSLTLRVTREQPESAVQINPATLRAVLDALQQAERMAEATGLVLGATTAAEILAMRGVLETATAQEDTAPLRAALLADLPALLADFDAMRQAEGAQLARLLASQIDSIAALTRQARDLAAARRDQMAASLRENLARVLANADGVDETRLAQELALIAVKTDVAEELDRLDAHIAAARDLLAQAGPVGRKFDFLMQEFNREANTLCSKAQSGALTRVGLDLKHVIDQMREQVQNVE